MPFYTLPPVPQCCQEQVFNPCCNPPPRDNNESAKVSRTTSQVVQQDTPTVLAFDNVVYDTDRLFDPSTPSTFFVRRDGFYIAGASIDWAPSGLSDPRKISILLDGTPMASISENSLATLDTLMTISTAGYFQRGQRVQLQVTQNSSSNLSIVTTGGAPTFWIQSVNLTGNNRC